MFSHVTLGTNDLARACAFYDAVLLPLGLERRMEEPDAGPNACCWAIPRMEGTPHFYAHRTFDGAPAAPGNGVMVAFLAPSRDAVDAAHAGGMAQGGADEGAPGERAHYGAGYYGAYLRDPDGNKVHVVHRGDLAGPGGVG